MSMQQIIVIVSINQTVQNVYKGCFLPTTANFLDDIFEKQQYLPISMKKNSNPVVVVVVVFVVVVAVVIPVHFAH